MQVEILRMRVKRIVLGLTIDLIDERANRRTNRRRKHRTPKRADSAITRRNHNHLRHVDS
ncbi:hypothetical protein [Microviridae sp.]|nr:hypothetical protein [Microviridae sp.]